jgi:hypothetical protein
MRRGDTVGALREAPLLRYEARFSRTNTNPSDFRQRGPCEGGERVGRWQYYSAAQSATLYSDGTV